MICLFTLCQLFVCIFAATQPGPQTPSTNGGQTNNGFTAVGLHAPNGTSSPTNSNVPQPLPIQAIRPIQAVQPQVKQFWI